MKTTCAALLLIFIAVESVTLTKPGFLAEMEGQYSDLDIDEDDICFEECKQGWCQKHCSSCSECTDEGCPDTCDPLCNDECKPCLECELQSDPCYDVCRWGWCYQSCDTCDQCETDENGNEICPQSCDSSCEEKCGNDCAMCVFMLEEEEEGYEEEVEEEEENVLVEVDEDDICFEECKQGWCQAQCYECTYEECLDEECPKACEDQDLCSQQCDSCLQCQQEIDPCFEECRWGWCYDQCNTCDQCVTVQKAGEEIYELCPDTCDPDCEEKCAKDCAECVVGMEEFQQD